MTDVLLVLIMAPDQTSAERIATELVETRLAACANIIPGLTSIYRWRGEMHRDPEVLMLVKTVRAAWERLRETVRNLHPNELPEIMAVEVSDGLATYLDWVAAEVRTNP
jgi:periplasmic divalent cation tolerance protein